MLDTLAGIKEGIWSRISFHQVEPRFNINIHVHQNQIFISATFGARAMHSKVIDVKSYCIKSRTRLSIFILLEGALGVGFTCRHWLNLHILESQLLRLVDQPSTCSSGFIDPTPVIVHVKKSLKLQDKRSQINSTRGRVQRCLISRSVVYSHCDLLHHNVNFIKMHIFQRNEIYLKCMKQS